MKLLTFLCSIAMLASTGIADPRIWEAPLAVCQGTYIQSGYASARNAGGDVLIVWSDAHTGDLDIYAQLINPQGVTQWGELGVAVVTAPNAQTAPMVVAVSDGWIVAWHDRRPPENGTESGQWLRAQKIGQDGSIRWLQNNGTGVSIDLAPVNWQSALVADSSDGAFLVWAGALNGTVFAQRLTNSGGVAWGGAVLLNQCGGSVPRLDAIVGINGSALVLWECRINGMSYGRIAKVTQNGDQPWGADGIPVGVNPALPQTMRLCGDGTGGCYVAWSDRRDLQNPNLYIQHFDADGQYQWPQSGVTLCNADGSEGFCRIAPSNNGGLNDGVLAVWEDRRVNGTVKEIYAQKMSVQGEPLWISNGVKVCGDAGGTSSNPSGATREEPELVSDSAGGLISVWSDDRTQTSEYYNRMDLYGGRVLSDGTLSWGESGRAVADGLHREGGQTLLPGDGATVLYRDQRHGSMSLRAQKISLTGQRQYLDSGVVIAEGWDTGVVSTQSVALGGGRAAIAWMDWRSNDQTRLYYQIVNGDGSVEQADGGIPLVIPDDTLTHQFDAFRMCTDNAGGFYVVYLEFMGSNAGRLARMAHVNNAGNLMTDPAGVIIPLPPNTVEVSKAWCAPYGVEGCYVALERYTPDYVQDISILRLNSTGSACWADAVLLTDITTNERIVNVIGNPEGSCSVIWLAGTWEHKRLQAARIHPEGWVQNTSTLVANMRELDDQFSIADDNNGFFVAWTQMRGTSDQLTVYVQHINAQDDPVWTPGGVGLNPNQVDQSGPALAHDRAGNLFVFWTESNSMTASDIIGQKLSATAQPLWSDRGIIVCGAAGDQYGPHMVFDDGSGVFVVWEDARSSDIGLKQAYGTHLQSNGLPVDDPYWVIDGSIVSDPDFVLQSAPLVCDDGGGFLVVWNRQYSWQGEGFEGAGIYAQRIRNVASAAAETPAVANTFELAQNFPNPFNPSTSISFSLPQTGQTKLTVYNVLGEEVARLTDRVMPAGKYRLTYNANALSSGIYFYRLESPAGTLTRRMLLLK